MEKNYAKKIYKICFPKCSKYDGAIRVYSCRHFFISVSSGANGLAVLNLILPVFGIMFAIGSMIGIGSATRYGIRRAKGEEADHYFTQSISWAVLFSIPFMLIGIFFPDKFLALLGADAELIALGKTYLRIVLVFAPFFMCNYSVTAFARNDYATSTVMAGSLPAVPSISCLITFLFSRQAWIFRCGAGNCFLSVCYDAGMFHALFQQKNATSVSNGKNCPCGI